MKIYVKVKVFSDASERSKARFSKFINEKHRIEFVNRKINESLTGDGFIINESMTHFGIDVYKNGLWSRAWEGWIPDNEIEILEIDVEE